MRVIGTTQDPDHIKTMIEDQRQSFLDADRKYGEYKPKPKSSKLTLKEDIKDTIKMVESTKKQKKTNTKNISKAIELAQLIAKEPKYVSKEPMDEVKDTINEIEKLLKLLN
jgi:neutral trehalase